MLHKIIYLSHGRQSFHDQTRYSVLTLLDLLLKHHRQDIQIVIYTDCPEEMPAHDLITTIYFTPEKIAGLRGPLDFVHRIKLEVMHHAETTLGLPFIFVDSDTRWLKIPDAPLTALAATAPTAPHKALVYMHKLEGQISLEFLPQYWKLLHKKKSQLSEWHLPLNDWTVWNSGVFGAPVQARGLFQRALAINDELLLHVSYRHGVEQLTLSLLAASEFQLQPFDEYLAHYWSHGSEFPFVVQRFFQKLPAGLPVEEQAGRAGLFQIENTELKAIQQARAHDLFGKWRRRLHNSFYKRKIDLIALGLRCRRARHNRQRVI